MTGGTPAELTLRVEMGCTPADMHRLLPGLATVRFDAARNQFLHEDDGRGWTLRMGVPRERRIAALRLPVLDVELVFHGYAREDIDAFMERFHAWFRRGGG